MTHLVHHIKKYLFPGLTAIPPAAYVASRGEVGEQFSSEHRSRGTRAIKSRWCHAAQQRRAAGAIGSPGPGLCLWSTRGRRWLLACSNLSFRAFSFTKRPITSTMKKEVAKTYSTEKIADVYLATLALDEGQGKDSVLPEVLRLQNIYFDQEIIAGVIQLLENRKYIEETGFVSSYILLQLPGDKRGVIIQSILPGSLKPNNSSVADFSSVVKGYKITGPGARFVRLGQVIDVQGKIEREAERKKWKERLHIKRHWLFKWPLLFSAFAALLYAPTTLLRPSVVSGGLAAHSRARPGLPGGIGGAGRGPTGRGTGRAGDPRGYGFAPRRLPAAGFGPGPQSPGAHRCQVRRRRISPGVCLPRKAAVPAGS
nr:hypothetical protein [Tanacetum cinerariifolium]